MPPSPSVRERVIQAWESLLAGLAPPAVPGPITVYRGRRREVPEAQLPALVLRTAGGGEEQVNSGVVRNLLRVTVEAQAKDSTDAGLDRQLADIAAALQGAVERDPTLGGLAVDTNPATEDLVTADDEGVGGIGVVLAVYDTEYWTRPGDPYAPAP